jgi:hypothetical protein
MISSEYIPSALGGVGQATSPRRFCLNGCALPRLTVTAER